MSSEDSTSSSSESSDEEPLSELQEVNSLADRTCKTEGDCYSYEECREGRCWPKMLDPRQRSSKNKPQKLSEFMLDLPAGQQLAARWIRIRMYIYEHNNDLLEFLNLHYTLKGPRLAHMLKLYQAADTEDRHMILVQNLIEAMQNVPVDLPSSYLPVFESQEAFNQHQRANIEVKSGSGQGFRIARDWLKLQRQAHALYVASGYVIELETDGPYARRLLHYNSEVTELLMEMDDKAPAILADKLVEPEIDTDFDDFRKRTTDHLYRSIMLLHWDVAPQQAPGVKHWVSEAVQSGHVMGQAFPFFVNLDTLAYTEKQMGDYGVSLENRNQLAFKAERVSSPDLPLYYDEVMAAQRVLQMSPCALANKNKGAVAAKNEYTFEEWHKKLKTSSEEWRTHGRFMYDYDEKTKTWRKMNVGNVLREFHLHDTSGDKERRYMNQVMRKGKLVLDTKAVKVPTECTVGFEQGGHQGSDSESEKSSESDEWTSDDSESELEEPKPKPKKKAKAKLSAADAAFVKAYEKYNKRYGTQRARRKWHVVIHTANGDPGCSGARAEGFLRGMGIVPTIKTGADATTARIEAKMIERRALTRAALKAKYDAKETAIVNGMFNEFLPAEIVTEFTLSQPELFARVESQLSKLKLTPTYFEPSYAMDVPTMAKNALTVKARETICAKRGENIDCHDRKRQPEPQPEPEFEPEPEIESQPQPEPQPEPEFEPEPKITSQPQPEPQPEPEFEPEPQAQPKPQPEPEFEPEPEIEIEPQAQLELELEPEPETQPQPDLYKKDKMFKQTIKPTMAKKALTVNARERLCAKRGEDNDCHGGEDFMDLYEKDTYQCRREGPLCIPYVKKAFVDDERPESSEEETDSEDEFEDTQTHGLITEGIKQKLFKPTKRQSSRKRRRRRTVPRKRNAPRVRASTVPNQYLLGADGFTVYHSRQRQTGPQRHTGKYRWHKVNIKQLGRNGLALLKKLRIQLKQNKSKASIKPVSCCGHLNKSFEEARNCHAKNLINRGVDKRKAYAIGTSLVCKYCRDRVLGADKHCKKPADQYLT